MTLNYDSVKIQVGKQIQLVVSLKPENSTETVTWTSWDPSVATVDENGYVTGLQLGSTCIEGILTNGKTVMCHVSVAPETVQMYSKLSAEKMVYTGKTCTPDVIVTDENGNVLTNGYDYGLIYSSYDRTEVGRYAVTVVPYKNYEGETTLYYTIVPKKTGSLSSVRYQFGNQVRLNWTKSAGASGYRIEYKKPGATKYTFLANTKNLYYTKSGFTEKKNYYFKVTPYVEIDGIKYYGTTSGAYRTTTIATVAKGKKLVQVAKPTVTKSGTKVKVKWKNVANETGYQISRSTSKTGTNIVATYATKTGTSKLVTASKGKVYYYKVRAYRTVDDKKIYGEWSTAVKFKR